MPRQRVLLIGAGGKTGESYARLLQSHGHHVLWYDKNPTATPQNLENAQLTHIGYDALEFSRLSGMYDLVTLTPGVPLKLPFILEARRHGIPVISEVAYCAPYLNDFVIVGITGTDGKSTTTTLIAQILNAVGHAAVECGNFGLPLSEIILRKELYQDKILSCELSSYQLEEPGNLRLDAAIFLNLAPDHLNRYATVEEYGLAKWNIVQCLKPGKPLIVAKALLPGTSPYWQNGHPLIQAKVATLAIDGEKLESPHFSVQQNVLFSGESEPLADLTQTALAGRHNFSNLLFALEAIYSLLGPDLLPKLRDALSGLKPLPHRFEIISQPDLPHIVFINDSKATTTQAAITALNNAKAPVFVFLGGQGKGESYAELARVLREKQAKALIYGECRNDMAHDFNLAGFNDYTLHENLFKAFHTAKRMVAQLKLETATLLLSPAATSWDQYKSFEERGEYFRTLVSSLSH